MTSVWSLFSFKRRDAHHCATSLTQLVSRLRTTGSLHAQHGSSRAAVHHRRSAADNILSTYAGDTSTSLDDLHAYPLVKNIFLELNTAIGVSRVSR